METTKTPLYDVFISYNIADRDWVEQWLITPLQQAGLRVSDYQDFIAGMYQTKNIERVVANSHRTVVVLTPEWFANEWNIFEGLLAHSLDPAARQRKLLPLVLRPCDLPPTLAALEHLDFTVDRYWQNELRRLLRDVRDTVPVTPPWENHRIRDLEQWRRWVWRYRRVLSRALVGLVCLWLCLALLLQWTPFQPRARWVAFDFKPHYPTQIFTQGANVLVGGANTRDCQQPETGLWRSADGGVTWSVAPVGALLTFQDPAQGCVLADIQGFAGGPGHLYAATSDVGVLTSVDAGITWQRAGALPVSHPPNLIAIAAAPDDAARVYTASADGGLFRSLDGGQTWQRLDAQAAPGVCAPGQSLSATLVAGALLVTPDYVIAGTSDLYGARSADMPAGLYLSADGGACWQRLSPTGESLAYLDIVALPQTDTILTLVYNPGEQTQEKTHEIWRWRLAAPERRDMVQQFANPLSALFVSDGMWYAATPLGGVATGAVERTGDMRWLSKLLLPCVVTCDVALAANPRVGAPPLLLLGRREIGGMVARYQVAHWRYQLWP